MKQDPAVVFHGVAQAVCLDRAQQIVDHIRNDKHCPIDTGELINGYRAVRHGSGAEVVTDVYYWKYVEYGTRNNHAQPHVRPAYEEVRLHPRPFRDRDRLA